MMNVDYTLHHTALHLLISAPLKVVEIHSRLLFSPSINTVAVHMKRNAQVFGAMRGWW